MPFRFHRSPRRTSRRAILGALLTALVAVTGFETATHGHVPALAGWHDATPHGTSTHDDGLKSCSICRLAHESGSAPIVPVDVPSLDRIADIPPSACEARSLAVLALERSPRAPPVDAAC